MARVSVQIAGIICLWWWWTLLADADYMQYKDPNQTAAVRVKDLLARMTLEEKIGQMVQIDRTVANADVMKSYFIGSILSGGGSVPLPEASAADWVNMINEFQNGSLSTRLGIPMIYGIDAVHGHNNVYNATIFPHNIGLGATRDPGLVRRIGAATAAEVRATGIPYVFAPCIAVCRDPRWGRCYESYSEDPKIVQEMTEIIPGLQGDIPADSRKGVPYVGKNKVAACAKHFVGDGGTTKGINENNTVIDRHGLLSIHMPGYYDSIIKGVSTVMVSYSSWNGVKMHANRELVTGFLKDTLNFKGFVISDWEGVDRITSPPHSNYSYSVQAAIQAGIDMVMVPFNYTEFIDDLTQLVKINIIPMDRIDDAVARILLVKFTMGLFENPMADFSLVNELGSQANRDLAREAVRKSLVLLKNGENKTNQLLPLSKRASKILVAGSHADNLGYQCGGWTINWQGFSGNNYTRGTTILGAVSSTVDASTEVVYRELPESDFVKSSNFDYAIVVVGEHPYAETGGDSMTLTMADPGPSVIKNVCEAVKCVVIIISGRPIVIEPYLSSINALVAAWLPGSEGLGVTDVLFGDYGFSGKLPRTWFRTVDQLPMNVGDSHYDPLFPFGSGLTTEPVRELVERSTSAAVGARPCILPSLVSVVTGLCFAGTTILGAVSSTVDASTEVVYRDIPDSDFVKSNNFEFAIIVVGEHPYAETGGDSMTLTMADPGPSVIKNVCEAVKCVVIIISGRPIVIEPYLSSIDALVAACLPGSEGLGVTDVLFGDYGFSGKLPRTWFGTVDQLPMNVGDSHYDPLFPFGSGLTTEPVRELVQRSTSAGVGAKPYMLPILVSVGISLYFVASKSLVQKK